MATTSIWSIKGCLGKVCVYVENSEKTTNPKLYEKENMTNEENQSLVDVIEYATNINKVSVKKTISTDDENIEILERFVSGINCSVDSARDEMFLIKKQYGKDDGIMAFHGYQSFAEGEVTPEQAHEIGVKLANELWGERFQVLVATHLDKEKHLHNHFVVNSVSFSDGKRYYRSKKDYYNMQKASDRLCREYGLSVIEKTNTGKSKHYSEYNAEQGDLPTWRGLIKKDIDIAIQQSLSKTQFFENLKKLGYEIKVGKDISVRPRNKERFVRLARSFGEEYTIENIYKRLLNEKPLMGNMAKPKIETYKTNKPYAQVKKITGYRALYFHYCYLLGAFPKKPQKKTSILLRAEVLKMVNISNQTKLLVKNKIDTADQLDAYKTKTKKQFDTLVEVRKKLYRKMRTKAIVQDPDKLLEVKKETASLTSQIKELRKELKNIEGIETRSRDKEENAHEETQQRKVKEKHEYGRR